MSTMLEEHPTHWVVSTIAATGKRRKISRLRVAIPKGDDAALQTEIIKQCENARRAAGVEIPVPEPVV